MFSRFIPRGIFAAALVVAGVTLFTPLTAWACSSCGCTLSPEWISEGYSATSGLRFDLRYDFLNQKELRSGAHSVPRSSLPIPNAEEIQGVTRTHMYTASVDYSTGLDWGVNISVPFIDRHHTAIAAGDTIESGSDTKDLGDVRILGRYQGFTDSKNTGVQFGVKLPTGGFHENVSSGPEAGEKLDRGLQPGTGTTDIMFGAYNIGALGKNFDRFAQVLVKMPLDSREDFRPGKSINANIGVRYLGFRKVIPQFQLNAKVEGRDKGADADTENSGSRVIYASPGVSYDLTPKVQLYGFAQLPVYQYYNGLQLMPHMTASVGISYKF